MAKQATKQVNSKKESSKTSLFLESIKKERPRFLIGVCTAFIGAFLLLGQISFFFTGDKDQSKVLNKSFWSLISEKQEIENWTGVIGAFVSEKMINDWFGVFSMLIPILLIITGFMLMRAIKIPYAKVFLLTIVTIIWGSLFSSLVLSSLFGESHIVWGGAHGQSIVEIMQQAIGIPGLILVLLLLFIIFLVLAKDTAVSTFQNRFGNMSKPMFPKINFWSRKKIEGEEDPDEDLSDDIGDTGYSEYIPPLNAKEEKLTTLSPEGFPPYEAPPVVKKKVADDFEIIVPKTEEINLPPPQKKTTLNKNSIDDHIIEGSVDDLEEYDPTKDLSNFSFPGYDLLIKYDTGGRGVNMEEQNENKNKIITTLQHYGIEITSIKATVGPTITLYEIVPKAGVRISKIKNLEDDIALSLSALGIRIIAPMPGKGTIGIEVPNKDPQIVSMQSVIASQKFQESKFDLPVALGRTITNDVFMFDLTKMPHLLVAGATGQGKSVGLNAIITSLLYKKHPAEMKMVLVDPKMVEFNIYSRIEKHYLAMLPDAEKAIITDVSRVTQTLNSLTKEMDDRYELLMNAGVRNIKEYNDKFKKRRLNPNKGHKFLPYIVVIIDEFGDLIMTAGKEIELPIARIAQKARAVGIHMIIATQRPTTNIITGTIKANFPARMAFRVTSQIDSRTILDMAGANQLIGRGDMLFSQGSDLTRIQCAFVDTPEVDEIAKHIEGQQGYATAFELPEFIIDGGSEGMVSIEPNDRDALFDEAARLIVIQQQGSTSLIQRKFSIGYNRAGRLMDQLEAAGIVGSAQGSKPRDVLIGDEYSLEKFLSK